MTYEGRPLVKSPKIAGEPIAKLFDVLKDTDSRVRYRARIELSGRDSREVADAAAKWVAGLDPKDPLYEHHRLEALWVHQHHNVVNADLLQKVLASPDYRARAAATRVLCCWRDRVPQALDLLRKLAADENARVRLEAVRSASFFTEPEAIEIVLIAEEHPTDKYLDYVRAETRKQLDPYWKKALQENRDIAIKSDAGATFFLRQISLEKLLAKPRTQAVFVELMNRPGVRDEIRREAIAGIAKLEKQTELQTLLNSIRAIDARPSVDQTVLFDLSRLLTGRNANELAQGRAALEQFATSAKQPIVRQVAFASLVGIDGNADKAWSVATKSPKALRDFLAAVPLISDAGLRASLLPKIQPLLKGLPPELAQPGASKKGGGLAHYVRIELPRRGTLTLAEVEVNSGGINIARRGKASQINTAHGGDASKAIDGNTNASYGGGGQTHTAENIDKPWWELDLSEDAPVDSIVIYNRGDGDLGKRLDGFTLRVMDADRNDLVRKEGLPAPSPRMQIDLEGGSTEMLVRRAAMDALISMRGHEAQVFQELAPFVHQDIDRASAIRALQRIPSKFWPAEQVGPLVDVLLAQIRKIPVENRTSQNALETLEFADALASLLPAEQGRKVRGELRDLGVRVIRI
ncbi:MAG TPA: HEAT repeat domain-containing protein, partial [Planctomycetaceae bacterium]|nr:HEAT repeat domain-containing protein [Planctomycetaceae bacterium]